MHLLKTIAQAADDPDRFASTRTAAAVELLLLMHDRFTAGTEPSAVLPLCGIGHLASTSSAAIYRIVRLSIPNTSTTSSVLSCRA